MKLTAFLFAALFCSPLLISAQRQKINFDNNWKFNFGHSANAEKDFNYTIANIFSKSGAAAKTAIDPRFDDSKWRKLDLPHDWVVELPFVYKDNFDVMAHGYKPVGGLFPETSIGWYRKHFMIAKEDSGQRFQLQFDGVFRDANIWVNGFFLGNNKSGYVGESYDITDYINFGRDNVVVVRADATQYEGWFYEGAGIYRHVWLNKFSNLHIETDGVFVYTELKGDVATVSVETSVKNKGMTTSNCTVHTYITDRNGKKLVQSKEQPLSIAVNGLATAKHITTLTGARRWSLEDPYLYRVVSVIRQNGNIIDSIKQRFGIRSIDIKANGVFLNDKHIKLQGVNNHQDHAGVGSALPDYLQYYRIRLLKNMGVNAYRTSHNAPTPELVDACDSLGMLVMDEQRLLNSSPEYMSQFERLIKRDRSRASVFMWSIGNEEGWIHTNSVGKRIAQTFIAKQKELDPTRTCTYAADVANVFNGINEVIPVRSFNYRQFAVADYHRDHPTQPIIGTEMGSTVTTRGEYEKDTVLALVASAERESEHPLAAAIIEGAKERGLKLYETEEFNSLTGRGIQALVDKHFLLIGNQLLLNENSVDTDALMAIADRLSGEGKTAILVAIDGLAAGVIGVADTIRPTSAASIAALQRLGLRTLMLTGDNLRTAQAIGEQVGIAESDIRAQVLPENKAAAVLELQRQGRLVAMVGDGINDAPALAQADVGFAVASGTDAAIEAADITLMSGSLNGVVTAIELSRATMGNIRQNLFFALIYNGLGLPIAAGLLYPVLGLRLNPMIAAGAMALSSLSVVFNANRLRRWRSSMTVD